MENVIKTVKHEVDRGTKRVNIVSSPQFSGNVVEFNFKKEGEGKHNGKIIGAQTT